MTAATDTPTPDPTDDPARATHTVTHTSGTRHAHLHYGPDRHPWDTAVAASEDWLAWFAAHGINARGPGALNIAMSGGVTADDDARTITFRTLDEREHDDTTNPEGRALPTTEHTVQLESRALPFPQPRYSPA